MPPNSSDLDYLGYLASESARFAEVVGQAPPDAAVPTCPGWTAADLLWHLGEVQWFWSTVVREKLSGEQAHARAPQRPEDWAGLLDFFAISSRGLHEILTATAPETEAWTWTSNQTVGFIRRRQAHEALIHRVDAELIAGGRAPIDPRLGADGTDETLRVMYCGVPHWGTFTPHAGRTVRLQASDTGDSWLVTTGRFTGTDPGDGKSIDETDIGVAYEDPGGQAAATITGSAADLDCWLWHRPPLGDVGRSGDPDVLSDFDAAIAPGIN
jgi:uncharacterized protein (TIGR03083 family)